MFFTSSAAYVGLVPLPLCRLAAVGCAWGIVYAGRRIDVLAPIAEPDQAGRAGGIAGWVSLLALAVVAGYLIGEGTGRW